MNLHGRIVSGRLLASIQLVLASRPCEGARRASGAGLTVQVRDGNISDADVAGLFAEFGLDYIILAGYLRLLPIPLGFERRVVNIHPSLLPKHGGPGMYGGRVHAAVIAAGEKVSGCTVHWCDGAFDRGDIILQRFCPVLPEDTSEALAARVFEQECEALPDAISMLGRI